MPGDGDIYVGFENSYASTATPIFFSTAMDTKGFAHRSYVAGNPSSATPPDLDNLGNNEALGVIDDITGGGLTGNWMIRATGTRRWWRRLHGTPRAVAHGDAVGRLGRGRREHGRHGQADAEPMAA